MSIALCYDKTKDKLYIGSEIGNNVLFVSHEEKGHNHNRPQFPVPETNFSIKIESNFKYGNRAYLRASMWYNNIPLFNFQNWLNCLNCKLLYFKVEPTPEHWEELFTKIIEIYKYRDSWNYNSIFNGLNALNDALSHPEEITVCNSPWLNPQTPWKEPLSILHLTRKFCELLDNLETLKLNEVNLFKEILNSICIKIMPLIITTYKHLIQKQQNEEEASHNITTYISGFDEKFDTLCSYLKHTNQLRLFFTNL